MCPKPEGGGKFQAENAWSETSIFILRLPENVIISGLSTGLDGCGECQAHAALTLISSLGFAIGNGVCTLE